MGIKYEVWFFRNNELQSEIRYLSWMTADKAKEAMIKSGVYTRDEIQKVERVK